MVDSSVWIDFFNGKVTSQTSKLLSLLGNEPLLVGDLILCEVLQGARSEAQARLLEEELRKLDLLPVWNPELGVAAAKNYIGCAARASRSAKPSISSSAPFASPTGTRSCTTIATLAMETRLGLKIVMNYLPSA